MDGVCAQGAAAHGSEVVRPVFLLAITVLGVLALIIAVMVYQFDMVSYQMQTQTAQQGYHNRLSETAALVQGKVANDQGLRHLALRFDPDWAESDMARPLYDRNGFTWAAVLDGANRPVFVAENGVARSVRALPSTLARAVADMLPAIRAAEQGRNARSGAIGSHTPEPVQQTSIAWHGGQLHIVTATLVQGEAGLTLPSGTRAPVVISALPFDGRLLARFGARHLVSDLQVRPFVDRQAQVTVLPLYDVQGRQQAALTWQTSRPGTELFARMKWPLVSMLGILMMLGWSLARQSSRYARGLIQSEARARHLAFHDALTELPNRVLMLERLNQLRAIARRSQLDVAVHCLDLDRFKEVNDTLGHPAGDALIRATAARLQSLLRETDTVARLGGDEFVILQPHTIAAGASHLAQRIIDAFAEPFVIEGQHVRIGCSIGITLICDAATPATEVLRQADLALYASKEAGRNRFTFFETEMDNAFKLRRALEADLREALAQDALHMVYQPQVDMAGRIVGVEALVRWNHPTRGAIAPTVFVALAEEAGLIASLGEYTVRRVFEDTRDMAGLLVAINVSALQLRSPDFMASVTRLVAEFGIDPAHYEFEITETVLLGDDAATRDTIAVLKQEGFAIALDDFGTGYSSLSSLQRFAVDRIKIDRSFVRNIDGGDADALTLIDAIIRLAHALDLEVIAEGVETIAERDHLIAGGCERFQGYLFAKPLLLSDLKALLAAGICPGEGAGAVDESFTEDRAA